MARAAARGKSRRLAVLETEQVEIGWQRHEIVPRNVSTVDRLSMLGDSLRRRAVR